MPLASDINRQQLDSTGANLATLSTLLAGEDQANPPIGVTSGSLVARPSAYETSISAAFTPTTVFSQTATVVPLGKIKAIWVVVSGITWTFTSGIPLLRVYTARAAVTANAASGATTALPAGAHYMGLGIIASAATIAFPLTAAGVTTLPVGNTWRLSATQWSTGAANTSPILTQIAGLPGLNDWDQFIGVEFQFPSAPTAGGNFNVFLEHAGV